MSGWNLKRIKRLFTTVPACDIVPCFICKVPYARADLTKCAVYACDCDVYSNYLCSVCVAAESTIRCGECNGAFCEESCAYSCHHCDVYICGLDNGCAVLCDSCDLEFCKTCANNHDCGSEIMKKIISP